MRVALGASSAIANGGTIQPECISKLRLWQYRMDRLTELALLVAISEEGGIAAAARRMRRAPSAATRMLRHLEGRLGVRLVERTTRRLVLTESGRRLVEHSRDILVRYDEAVADAAVDRAVPRGTLKITAPLAFGQLHLTPLVARYLAAHPQVNAEMTLCNEVVDFVKSGMDVAVRIGPLSDSTLASRSVGWVRRVVVASPAYLATRGTPKAPVDIADHVVVQQASEGGLQPWRFGNRRRGARGVNPKARLIVNQAESAVSAALAGFGLARPLSYQVSGAIREGRLVRVLRDFEPPPLRVNLIFSSSRLLPLRVRTFVDFAASELMALDAIRD